MRSEKSQNAKFMELVNQNSVAIGRLIKGILKNYRKSCRSMYAFLKNPNSFFLFSATAQNLVVFISRNKHRNRCLGGNERLHCARFVSKELKRFVAQCNFSFAIGAIDSTNKNKILCFVYYIYSISDLSLFFVALWKLFINNVWL